MTQPSVLLVEDEPAQREVLAYNLAAEGFVVQTAATAPETIGATKAPRFTER